MPLKSRVIILIRSLEQENRFVKKNYQRIIVDEIIALLKKDREDL